LSWGAYVLGGRLSEGAFVRGGAYVRGGQVSGGASVRIPGNFKGFTSRVREAAWRVICIPPPIMLFVLCRCVRAGLRACVHVHAPTCRNDHEARFSLPFPSLTLPPFSPSSPPVLSFILLSLSLPCSPVSFLICTFLIPTPSRSGLSLVDKRFLCIFRLNFAEIHTPIVSCIIIRPPGTVVREVFCFTRDV